MKIIFSSLFLLSFLSLAAGQILPMRNADSLIIANNVHVANSYFHDSTLVKDFVIQRLEFNAGGLLSTEFTLSLWDVVSYSTTKTFTYNESGKPTLMTLKQEILNLYPRDDEYIESFGDRPVYEKIRYEYNEDGLPVKEDIFVYYSEILPVDARPNQSITYQYEGNLLVYEESVSAEVRVFNKNYTVENRYDSIGNLTKSIRTFGKDRLKTTETTMLYDSAGLLAEKITIDALSPHNNSHQKFEYDQSGNLTGIYLYSPEIADFELQTSFKYNTYGHRTTGDFGNATFEYFENGLIKSETREVPNMEQIFRFTTEYSYF